MVVSFFGHRDCPTCVKSFLKRLLEDLILDHQANLFYIGNQGAFDCIVRQCLLDLKGKYCDIECVEVLAYFPQEKLVDTPFETVYPEVLENTPQRYAICKRNQWMLKQADIVVMYVTYSFGNSAQLKKLAEKSKKIVINLPDIIEIQSEKEL